MSSLRAPRFALGAAIAMLSVVPARADPLYSLDSTSLGDGRMAIAVREVERRPRSSVVAVEIRQLGSSVGSSFFIGCAIRDLARVRGGFTRIAKLEEYPQRGQMLIGFLAGADESASALGPEFARAGVMVVDLEQLAPICDPMLRGKETRP